MDDMGVEGIMKQENKIMFIMLPVIMLLLLTGCSLDKKKLEDKALDKAEEMMENAFDKASDIVDKALDKATGDDENIGEIPRLKEGFIPTAYVEAEVDRVAGVIRDGFIAEDTERIKELFSEYAHEKYDLDAQIADAFKFIDGEIVSVGEICDTSGSESSTMEHGIVKSKYGSCINEVRTDTGKSYTIDFWLYYNYKAHEEKVGVKRIYISDDAASRDRAGNLPPEDECRIGGD